MIPEVHLRWSSDHVQVDDLFGFGGEVWEERFLDAGRSGGEQLVGHAFAQQGSEGGPAQHIFPAGEELTARLVADEVVLKAHGVMGVKVDYLFRTSSRFIN